MTDVHSANTLSTGITPSRARRNAERFAEIVGRELLLNDALICNAFALLANGGAHLDGVLGALIRHYAGLTEKVLQDVVAGSLATCAVAKPHRAWVVCTRTPYHGEHLDDAEAFSTRAAAVARAEARARMEADRQGSTAHPMRPAALHDGWFGWEVESPSGGTWMQFVAVPLEVDDAP